MKHSNLVVLFTAVTAGMGSAAATNLPLGVASPYNIFSFTTLNTGSDVEGRVAAGGLITGGPVIAANIAAGITVDPYPANYTWTLYAAAGISGGGVLDNGVAYLPSGTINKNGTATTVTTTAAFGAIDFAAAKTQLQDYSRNTLGALATNCGQSAALCVNTSDINHTVLKGLNASLNIFNISAAVFQSNARLDIQIPNGATAVINVTGASSMSFNGQINLNGNQTSGDSTADENILFNFPTATAVAINGQFSASVLAPYASFSSSSQVDGSIIANAVTGTGEVHDPLFSSTVLPSMTTTTPEPSTGLFLISGFALLGLGNRLRRRANPILVRKDAQY